MVRDERYVPEVSKRDNYLFFPFSLERGRNETDYSKFPPSSSSSPSKLLTDSENKFLFFSLQQRENNARVQFGGTCKTQERSVTYGKEEWGNQENLRRSTERRTTQIPFAKKKLMGAQPFKLFSFTNFTVEAEEAQGPTQKNANLICRTTRSCAIIEEETYAPAHARSFDLRWRRSLRDHVYLPRGLRAGVLVRRVASPQTLDESGRGYASADHMLLPLLLLDLEREARAEDALKKVKNGIHALVS